MSVYTTELRYYIESLAPDKIKGDIGAMCLNADHHIFTYHHPMWGGENERQKLHTSILKHFYFREIGFETVALWKFFLNRKMMEMMPRYVELYNTTTYEYDLMSPISFRESYNEQGENTSHNTVSSSESSISEQDIGTTSETTDATDLSSEHTSNSTANGQNINSDLPQATFSARADYATNSSTTENSQNTVDTDTSGTGSHHSGYDTSHVMDNLELGRDETGEQTGTYSTDHVITREGNMGISGPTLIQEARDIILNIPIMIFDELEELFMSLW